MEPKWDGILCHKLGPTAIDCTGSWPERDQEEEMDRKWISLPWFDFLVIRELFIAFILCGARVSHLPEKTTQVLCRFYPQLKLWDS